MDIITEKQKISFKEYEDIEKKLEIKYGRILEVEEVPKSEKLLKLKVVFDNNGNDVRTVVTNIKSKLTNWQYLRNQGSFFITNLEPVKIMGIESTAMILPLDYEGGFLWPNSITGSRLM